MKGLAEWTILIQELKYGSYRKEQRFFQQHNHKV
jgi:hypothetical protein